MTPAPPPPPLKPADCLHPDWEVRRRGWLLQRWPYCTRCGIPATRWVD